MSQAPTKITFFEFLTPLITSGMKTITIRDEAESHYVPGTQVEVFTLETDKKVCEIKILSVEPLQEALPLDELKRLIGEIYPDLDQLYMISYELV